MTDELKAMLKAAKTDEEAKEILLAYKSELSEEELEKISGGRVIDFLKTLHACKNSMIYCKEPGL